MTSKTYYLDFSTKEKPHDKMKKILLILFLIIFKNVSFSQSTFHPEISELKEIDSLKIEEFNNCKILLRKLENINSDLNKLSFDEKKQLENCSECKVSVYDLLDCGCSWYCGGQIDTLISETKDIIDLKKVHDLNYSTSIHIKVNSKFTFKFKPESSRVTDIIFINGDSKNKKSFYEFSRVKKLKIFYNQKVLGIFELKDEFAEQTFSVGSLGNKINTKNKRNWTLTFEILESYPGKKDDIVISDIYFLGEHE